MKDVRKITNAWAFYDWANSVYPLVITAAIFPAFYENVTRGTTGEDVIRFFGFPIVNTVLYSYAFSFSYLVIAFLSPFLSGIADYTGRKKNFMRFFVFLGALACSSLFFFNGKNIYLGITAFMLASIGFNGSLVFYNSYLPEIASTGNMDKVSAKGFSLGYLGSVILLLLNLVFIMNAENMGIRDQLLPYQLSFLSVGIWWIGFSQYSFYYLPKPLAGLKKDQSYLLSGFRELHHVWLQLKHLRNLKLFLGGFFMFSMGVQTVIYMSTLFGVKEIHIPTESLIIAILLIQFLGIAGAFLFSDLSLRIGNIASLITGVLLWIFMCIMAYFIRNTMDFFLVAALVGLLMGGTQSLARSTYSKLIPADTIDFASFFSFYEFSEKVAIVIGTAVYGMVEMATGSMRNSVFGLTLFFALSLAFLPFVKMRK